MRKAFLEQLKNLVWIYWDCLDKETGQTYNKFEEALKKSISQPEPKALNTKYLSKTIPLPKTKQPRIITQNRNLYEEARVEKPKNVKPKRAYQKRERLDEK